MEEILELVIGLITDLQNDETIDLSDYSERFVETSEGVEQIANHISTFDETNTSNENLISELKSANWDLSKKITKKEDIVEDEVEDEEDEEEYYETLDDAVADLFKEEKDGED